MNTVWQIKQREKRMLLQNIHHEFKHETQYTINHSKLCITSYLCKIKRKENSSCSACGHHLQDLTNLLLDCPASEPLRRAIFGITSSILTSGPDLAAWPDCWVSVKFLQAPIPRKGSGSTTIIYNLKIFEYLHLFIRDLLQLPEWTFDRKRI